MDYSDLWSTQIILNQLGLLGSYALYTFNQLLTKIKFNEKALF